MPARKVKTPSFSDANLFAYNTSDLKAPAFEPGDEKSFL
jgi:hypothetical protein